MIDKIIDIVANRTGIPSSVINADTNLLDFDIDSLDVINIVMDVEYSFNVKFEDDEIVELRTPKDIEQIILKNYA
ncbi:MAG: acyl carrier protein [Ruminococcaceae bacterium]|nr:acyl carrier protein [Oscillospiraceae bacterium]